MSLDSLFYNSSRVCAVSFQTVKPIRFSMLSKAGQRVVWDEIQFRYNESVHIFF